MFCWIDNSVVKKISNLHLGSSDKKGLKGRKRPELNGFNNKNVCLVWGEEFINVDRNTNNHWSIQSLDAGHGYDGSANCIVVS